MYFNFLRIRRFVKIALITIGVMLLIPVLLVLLIQISSVQQMVKDKLAGNLSRKSGMEVKIRHVQLALPYYIRVSGVTIHDHHKQLMLSAESSSIKVRSYGFRSGVIRIHQLTLSKPAIWHTKYTGESTDNLSLFLQKISGPQKKKTPGETASTVRVDRITLKNGRYVSALSSKRNSSTSIDFNHLNLSEIYTDISNISLQGNDASFKVNRMRFKEQKGFILQDLAAQAEISETSIRLRNLTIETPKSALALDLSFHYLDFSDFNDFIDKVMIRSQIGNSRLSTHDLGYFVPAFYKTDNILNLRGSIMGSLGDFSTRGLQFSSGSTSFDGEIAMEGLPDFENTMISLDIRHLIMDPLDLARWSYTRGADRNYLNLPPEVTGLGPVSVEGKFNGRYRDFVAQAGFTGQFGNITANMQLSETGGVYYADGSLGVNDVDAGKYLRESRLGKVSFDLDISGSATDKTWDFTVDGLVHALAFNGYDYRNIGIDGKVLDRRFIGSVDMEDRNIALNFNGNIDFNARIPEYNFVADIRKANLFNLGFVNDSLKGLLSAKLSIDMKGNHPDNLSGLAEVEFAEFNTPARNYQLSSLKINTVASQENKRKLIVVRSDYLDGDIYGNFTYAALPEAIRQFLQPYLPDLTKKLFRAGAETAMNGDRNDIFLDIKLKQTGNLTQLFTGTRIDASLIDLRGSYQQEQRKLRLNVNAATVKMGSRSLENWYLNLYNNGKGLVTETGAQMAGLSDTLNIFAPSWESTTLDNNTNSLITCKFQPDAPEPEGVIRSEIQLHDFSDLKVILTEGYISLSDTLWQIRNGSTVSLRNKSLDIQNFEFYSNSQKITIDGESAELSDHSITATFEKIDLSWIDFLTVPAGVDLDGAISGKVNLKNIFDEIRILSDLTIADFAMNGDRLGDFNLMSMWDDRLQGMKLAGNFLYQGNAGVKRTAEISGYLFPLARDRDNFDLTVDFDNFRLNLLSSILSSISTDIRGFGMGKLHLGGTFRSPEVTGKLKATVRNMFIDYLNTWYSFTDTITFTRDAIIFKNIQLSDNNRGNSREPYEGVLNGTISHRGFSKFNFNLGIRAQNFTFMNTNGEQDPYYFGKAVASGNVSITGPDNSLLIKIQATTERNTLLEIPVTSSTEVTKSSFITFVNKSAGEDDDVPVPARKRRENSLRMDMNIRVTPDATVRLVFDPLVGDLIQATGSGDLQMEIDSKGDFALRGQYVLNSGDYMFNLENIFSKKFNIKSGSTIRWNGDPYDAILDIEAIYPTKAHLSPLNPEDSTLSAQSVNCVIYMSDKLSNPSIRFGIEFPDMTSFDAERYQALIKPNLNYHFLSLLAISRFVNTQSQQFLEAGSSANLANVSTTEILANQLSLWLSSISDRFEVDFAYHPGSYLGQEQVDAALKTQILNDRLTIESKVGFGGGNYAGSNEQTSNMVGDFQAEYRIDKEGKFRVKAYNRHNGYNVLYEGAPYTQGVGVFYRREFNHLRDVIRKQKKEQAAGTGN